MKAAIAILGLVFALSAVAFADDDTTAGATNSDTSTATTGDTGAAQGSDSGTAVKKGKKEDKSAAGSEAGTTE